VNMFTNKNKFFENWKDDKMAITVSFQRQIIKMDKILANFPKTQTAVNEWVLESIGKLSIMQILKGLQQVIQTLNKTEDKLINLLTDSFKENLEKELSSYQWEQDSEAPLGLKQRSQELFEYYSENCGYTFLIEKVLPSLLKSKKESDPNGDGFAISEYAIQKLREKIKLKEELFLKSNS
jgi:hypothetical protein